MTFLFGSTNDGFLDEEGLLWPELFLDDALLLSDSVFLRVKLLSLDCSFTLELLFELVCSERLDEPSVSCLLSELSLLTGLSLDATGFEPEISDFDDAWVLVVSFLSEEFALLVDFASVDVLRLGIADLSGFSSFLT